MKNYIALLEQAVPGISIEDMDIPFSETGIHSLDSVILRATIESYFGFEIADGDWYRFTTLSDIMAFCCNKKSNAQRLHLSETRISTAREQEIRIPQMANSALSENWLLKELGDMHWEMLGIGLEQKPSRFTDNYGNRLYAAFVRVCHSTAPLHHFNENDVLQLDGRIKRSGNHTYCSAVDGVCDERSIAATMMTSFSARKANDNAQISKGEPDEKVNHIEEFDATPEFYSEHRLVKKGMISEIYSGGHCFRLTDTAIESITHTINPHYEINGVGLLYFASFPMIADECTSVFMKNTMAITDYDATYYTTYRDIFYFANCNAGDRIKVELNTIEDLADNRLKITTTLYRESDNKMMAKVLTIKQR